MFGIHATCPPALIFNTRLSSPAGFLLCVFEGNEKPDIGYFGWGKNASMIDKIMRK